MKPKIKPVTILTTPFKMINSIVFLIPGLIFAQIFHMIDGHDHHAVFGDSFFMVKKGVKIVNADEVTFKREI